MQLFSTQYGQYSMQHHYDPPTQSTIFVHTRFTRKKMTILFYVYSIINKHTLMALIVTETEQTYLNYPRTSE